MRFVLISTLLIVMGSGLLASGQTGSSPFPQATDLQQGAPLTNQEFVRLLYQLPAHPESAKPGR